MQNNHQDLQILAEGHIVANSMRAHGEKSLCSMHNLSLEGVFIAKPSQTGKGCTLTIVGVTI